MVTMRHEVKYQGYPCITGGYTRSIGLGPDTGFVDIDIAILKKVQVNPLEFRFRNIGSQEMGGQPLAARLLRKITGQQELEQIENPNEGLNEFGDLEFKSLVDGGDQLDGITYRDIYVSNSGMQEITQDLANVAKHEEGTIRVQLTDIRQFYMSYAPFYQRINSILRSGKFESESIKKDGKAFTALEVFQLLFLQLPGAPLIVGGDITSKKFDDPVDVVGDGQPVAQVIQTLLDQYRLDACFMPNGNYALNLRNVEEELGTKVPSDPGKQRNQTHLSYETKGIHLGDRPPMVEVIGQKVVKRVNVNYVPVFKDLDGTLRRLEDIEKLWGYSLSRVQDQVFSTTTSSYEDVPSGVIASENIAFRRREILKEQAYKAYAPAFMFTEPAAFLGARVAGFAGGAQVATGSSIPGFADGDEVNIPWLPMTEAPLYKTQKKEAGEGIFPFSFGKPNVEDVVLSPPLVQATFLTSGHFTDFGEIEKRFNSIIGRLKDSRLDYVKRRARAIKQLQINADRLKSIEAALLTEIEGLHGSKFLTEWENNLQRFFNGKPLDYRRAELFYRSQIDGLKLEEPFIQADISESSKKIVAIQKEIKSWEAQFKAFLKAYDKFGSVWLRYNVPNQIMSSGFAYDKKTGIIQFNSPVAIGDQPFYLDGDTVKAIGDGSVRVIYGVESNTNTKLDFTTFQVAATDANTNPTTEVISANTHSAIPPYIIYAPTMRLYQEENGDYMNMRKLSDEAKKAATPILSVPKVAASFDKEFAGLQKIVLDKGVTQVTHIFDGDTAITQMAVNNYAARHALGSAESKVEIDTDLAKAAALFFNRGKLD